MDGPFSEMMERRCSIYLDEEFKIPEHDFKKFLEQVSHSNIVDITLCEKIKNNWLVFLKSIEYKKPDLIDILPLNGRGKFDFLPNNTKKPGVYSIFANTPDHHSLRCFYVGMSLNESINGRLKKHLNKDVDPDNKQYGPLGYGKIYHLLRKCTKIILCYATINKYCCDEKLSNGLELLEKMLDFKLLPLFSYKVKVGLIK